MPESQSDLHGWIYGCDVCQEVCPWNEKFAIETKTGEFQPRKEIVEFISEDWDSLDEGSFKRIFKDSAVKRTKYVGLKRNIDQN